MIEMITGVDIPVQNNKKIFNFSIRTVGTEYKFQTIETKTPNPGIVQEWKTAIMKTVEEMQNKISTEEHNMKKSQVNPKNLENVSLTDLKKILKDSDVAMDKEINQVLAVYLDKKIAILKQLESQEISAIMKRKEQIKNQILNELK